MLPGPKAPRSTMTKPKFVPCVTMVWYRGTGGPSQPETSSIVSRSTRLPEPPRAEATVQATSHAHIGGSEAAGARRHGAGAHERVRHPLNQCFTLRDSLVCNTAARLVKLRPLCGCCAWLF